MRVLTSVMKMIAMGATGRRRLRAAYRPKDGIIDGSVLARSQRPAAAARVS
jgi:hypothetical protein